MIVEIRIGSRGSTFGNIVQMLKLDPFAAKDAIEERIESIICECQILNNETEKRQKALANAFGADSGEPGRDFDFFLTLVIRWLLYFIFLAFNFGLCTSVIPLKKVESEPL